MFRYLCTLLVVCAAPVALGQTSCSVQQGAAFGKHVWLLCQGRQVLTSSDTGTSWEARALPSDVLFHAIALLDERRAFVAGDRGTLLATEDGGVSWRTVALPTANDLAAIHFAGNFGWIAGALGTILHSSDGGRTWQPQTSGVRLGLDAIYFTDPLHGWAAGWVGTILRTTDGGKTWQRAKTPTTSWSLSSVYFRDLNHGWAVGFNGQILESGDGGQSWTPRPSGTQAWLTSVVFDEAGRGWVAARDGALLSADGGKTWNLVRTEGAPFLTQILLVNGSVWAIGQFGVMRSAPASQEFAAVNIVIGGAAGV